MSQVGLGLAGPPSGAPKPKRRRGFISVVIALVVVGALLAGVVYLAYGLLGFGGTDDYPGPGSGEATVVIPPGATLTAMGILLTDAGVVASPEAFVQAATANERAVQIQPGTYSLLLQMPAADAVVALLDPANRVEDKVLIPEGRQVSETVARLAKKTPLTLKALEKALNRPKTLGLPDYAEDNPEGFLFPATYIVQPDTSAEEQLRAMVKRFDEAAAAVDLEARAELAGLTSYETVIVASLLEAEGRPDTFAKIARVIYNRLDAGMPLQLDATVNYALGRSDIRLSTDDLTVDSPYNTYLYPGLPPAPINSPGEQALEAALAPADGPWLYYVTVDPATGLTKFTDSYAEFLKFKAEFKAGQ